MGKFIEGVYILKYMGEMYIILYIYIYIYMWRWRCCDFQCQQGAKEVIRPKGNKGGPKGLEIGRMGCVGPSQGHNNKHAHYHLQEC